MAQGLRLYKNPADSEVYEEIQLDAGDITSKQVTLSYIPVHPDRLDLEVLFGCSQRYLTDFVVSGAVLSWNGLGLEPLLEANDVLMIRYFI